MGSPQHPKIEELVKRSSGGGGEICRRECCQFFTGANEERSTTLATHPCLLAVLINEAAPPRSQVEGKPKPNSFYLTLIVGDKLLHNSLIDSCASTIVMPKQIVEILNIRYEPLSRGIMQLDGNKVQNVDLIKSSTNIVHMS